MLVEKEQYQSLYTELAEYEKYGIRMKIDGKPASPMQIAAAHMVKEDSGYMRDYILDEEGHVEELLFDRVKEQN